MSIADCRRAFHEGLEGRASCVGNPQLGYVDGGKRQRLTFSVAKPNGAIVEVGATIPASVDPTKASRAMAEYFAATLSGVAGPFVLPVTVEKPGQVGQEIVPVITERMADSQTASGVPAAANSASDIKPAPTDSLYDGVAARVGADASLDVLKRALVEALAATNDGFKGRTAEWQDELAKRTAPIWVATTLAGVKAAFQSVEAFLRGGA